MNTPFAVNANVWTPILGPSIPFPLHSIYIGALPDPTSSVSTPKLYVKIQDEIPRGPYYAGQTLHPKHLMANNDQIPEIQVMCTVSGMLEFDFNGGVDGAPLMPNRAAVTSTGTLIAAPAILDLIPISMNTPIEVWLNHGNPSPYTTINVTAILETAPGNGGKVDNFQLWVDELVGLTDPTLQSGGIQVINTTAIGGPVNWDPTTPSPAPVIQGTANLEYGHGFRFRLTDVRVANLSGNPNFNLRTIGRLI